MSPMSVIKKSANHGRNISAGDGDGGSDGTATTHPKHKGYTIYTHRIYIIFSTLNFNHKEYKPSARPSKPQIIFVSLFEIEHDYDEEKKKCSWICNYEATSR